MQTLIASLHDALAEIHKHEADSDYCKALAAYLGLWINRTAQRGSRASIWNIQGENVEHPFSLAKISMTWDYPEVNPFSQSTGSAAGGLDWIARVVEHERGTAETPLSAIVQCGDAAHLAAMPFRSERRRSASSLRAAKCVSISDNPRLWTRAFEFSKKEQERLSSMLSKMKQAINDQPSLFADEAEFVEARGRAQVRIQEAQALLSSDFTLEQYVAWMRQDQLGTVIVLDGFIPVGRADESSVFEQFFYRVFDQPSFGRKEWLFDIGALAMYGGRATENALARLFPLGPFRKPPERWYIFTGTSPQDVGYQGNLLPDLLYRHPEVRENTNEWLARLDIGYQIHTRPIGEDVSDLFEVRLQDSKRNTPVEVGLSDVGFGLSQLLPFIVQSLAASEQIITIEQPEVHIHPRLQADLGDLLAACIKEPRWNQFIIETHSEHLALRIQKLVRKGTLTPDDVSVVYVSRGTNGATVSPLRLDEEGDFIDDFPGGFFPERLRELR